MPLPGLAFRGSRSSIRATHLLSGSARTPKCRLFTQNSQLLLVAHASPRPQLPFLARLSSPQPRRLPRGGQWQFSRLLTTERRQYLREQIWLSGKYLAYSSVAWACIVVLLFGIDNERLGLQFPTPSEWSFQSRLDYRHARREETVSDDGESIVDWAKVGSLYQRLLRRLEDPGKDGAGLKEQADGGILVAGVGRAGFDIHDKPYPWRRGYYEALRGAARAAENLDGWLMDPTRKIASPPEQVIGPSNPNPRPCPPGSNEALHEEKCVPAFDAPDTYYLKILTTRGFTTRERVDAALAYADWLDFRQLHTTAEAMCQWALDIAASIYEDPSSVVDSSTGIIAPQAKDVSSNVFLAAKALGIHYAQTTNFASALPTLLSIYRVWTALPTTPQPPFSRDPSPPSTLDLLRNLVSPRPYPAPPPSGDDPARRISGDSECETATLKTYIGEILFASSSERDGLVWTQSAANLASGAYPSASKSEVKEQCRQCLELALGNWRQMAAKLAREEERTGRDPLASAWTWSLWSGPRGGDGKKSKDSFRPSGAARQGKWARELDEVERQIRVAQGLLPEARS
ncbi:MAG: hypothetical protein M1838_001478 [Thelocarpon superellum]|nr:MAG: hypothetical protein M1838_001478 [Thelocarpon superellum]